MSRIHVARIEYAVKDVIPNIVKELLTLYIPPRTLNRKVDSVRRFDPPLLFKDWTKIRNATSTGYRDFDMPLVLNLLKHLCGQNMGPKVYHGLDIYSRYYDRFAHTLPSPIITEEDFVTSFNDFENIAKAFDTIMNKRSNELVSRLKQLREGGMDYHL